MKKPYLLLTLLMLPLFLHAWADWNSVANAHYRIYFKGQYETEARNALKTLEYYRPQLEKLTGNSKAQIPITIEDLGNVINGYTDIYSTRIALFAYPPTADELAVCEDWWQLVGCHEYIHMLQMTREEGIPRLLRIGIGNYLYPEMWQPGWMTEGITVYGEAQLSPYSGRLNGGTYHSIIQSLAKQDKLPSPTKANYPGFDAPHTSYYNYGGVFFEYLAKTYGEDKFAELYDVTSTSPFAYVNGVFPFFNLDWAYQHTYGKSLNELWTEWKHYEKELPYRQPVRNLTSDGWYKSNLQIADDKLYYTAGKAVKTGPGSSFFSNKLYQVDLANLPVTDDKLSGQAFRNDIIQPQVLVEQSTEFPAGYRIANGSVYYSRTELKTGYANNELDGYGGSVQILKQDLSTGKREMLYTGKVRSFLPMPDGSLLISEDNATHTASILYKVMPGSKDRLELYKPNFLIHTILPDGHNLILGIKSPWQNCSIYRFNLTDFGLEPLINTPFYATPVTVEGDTLIFNAVFDGKTGAYAYNLATRLCYKYDNVDDIRTPVILPDGEALFISLNPKGYDLYRDELALAPYALPDDDIPGNPMDREGNQTELAVKYLPDSKLTTCLANLGHAAVPRLMHFPILMSTGDSLAFGYSFSGSDAVGDFPYWFANLLYDTKYSRFKYSVSVENNFFRPLKQSIGYSNLDGKSLSAIQSISLHKQANYGLQAANLGFSFITREDYSRKVWTPFADASLGWTSGSLFARQYLPFETKSFLPSDRNRLGWVSFLLYHQKLPFSSELKASAVIADDIDADNDEVFGRIRGYDHSFAANQGTVIQASWYKPIIKVREGLWNPQIYIEDVNLGFFYDTAIPAGDATVKSQAAGGMEVITELGVFYYLRLNLGVRFSYNKEQEAMSQIFIGTLF